MLARYHRWVYDNFEIESEKTLREEVEQESQFHSFAHETVTVAGLSKE